mgnify:CR=1 FL=1
MDPEKPRGLGWWGGPKDAWDRLIVLQNRLNVHSTTGVLSDRVKAVEEKFNPDITECFRNPNWENSKHPLLHQFRKYYPSKEEYNSIYATPDHYILTESFKK